MNPCLDSGPTPKISHYVSANIPNPEKIQIQGHFCSQMFFFFVVLKNKVRTLYILGKYSTTELHPQPLQAFLMKDPQPTLCNTGVVKPKVYNNYIYSLLPQRKGKGRL
jgi:hypothetical protein